MKKNLPFIYFGIPQNPLVFSWLVPQMAAARLLVTFTTTLGNQRLAGLPLHNTVVLREYLLWQTGFTPHNPGKFQVFLKEFLHIKKIHRQLRLFSAIFLVLVDLWKILISQRQTRASFSSFIGYCWGSTVSSWTGNIKAAKLESVRINSAN